jgi:hypothetical protein
MSFLVYVIPKFGKDMRKDIVKVGLFNGKGCDGGEASVEILTPYLKSRHSVGILLDACIFSV